MYVLVQKALKGNEEENTKTCPPTSKIQNRIKAK